MIGATVIQNDWFGGQKQASRWEFPGRQQADETPEGPQMTDHAPQVRGYGYHMTDNNSETHESRIKRKILSMTQVFLRS